MIKVDNYSDLSSLTSAMSSHNESCEVDGTRPELLPPGAQHEIVAMPESEERRLKQQAYTGYFIQHLVRFTMSSVSFGLSLAAAILSGGTGIPLAVVTGTAMIVAAGDACCALYNMIQVRNDREPLSVGNDSIVLATKALMMACGMTDSHAEMAGDSTSFVLRAGLALSSMFLPLAHLPGSIESTLSLVSSGITASLIIAGGGIDIYTARVERLQGRAAAAVSPQNDVEDDDSKDVLAALYKRLEKETSAPAPWSAC